MIYFIIFVLLLWIWLIAEAINAPIIKSNTNNDSATKSNDTHNKGL